jgi:squalene-associated FAD-dependent desaturase
VSRTVIVGGGLAGLSAAVALAQRGIPSTILESRPRLGGRASSFTDPASGQLVDACQHVSMGCCTAFARFCETIGVSHLLAPQPKLWFVTSDGRESVFRADPWPAPFHLGRALLGAHYLTATEKLRIAFGLAMLIKERPEADPPLLPWLLAHRQTPRTIARFWGVVLTSALNETVERVGLKYARKVFRDGFIADRDGFTVQLPTVPLAKLYGDELRAWLASHNVEVRENTGVKAWQPGGVILRDGTALVAENVILAVPFDRVLGLLPAEVAADPFFARIAKLEPSPITSVHLWFDRPIMTRPHLVVVDGLSQWIFARDGGYVQVVVSASCSLRGLNRDEIQKIILFDLKRLLPVSITANLLRAKVVTEHTATLSAVPGVDAMRPSQWTPIPGLFLAGDWTDTGWPATMESAVRSGTFAADAVRATSPRRMEWTIRHE